MSFEGGGMGFRRTILLTRLSFWTISTRNGRRKKGWRTGRIASRSRLNTREVACWLGQRESSSRPTTLLNRHRLIFSSKFDWFFDIPSSKLFQIYTSFALGALPIYRREQVSLLFKSVNDRLYSVCWNLAIGKPSLRTFMLPPITFLIKGKYKKERNCST